MTMIQVVGLQHIRLTNLLCDSVSCSKYHIKRNAFFISFLVDYT